MMPQKKAARRKSERRVKERADAKLSMRVEGAPEGAPTQIVTESQNISASGVYCNSSHFLAPLSRVSLTIVLPRVPGGRGVKELIKCDGIVVRCLPVTRKTERLWELACMFSDLDTERRSMLEEFVTWRNLQALRAAARATPVRRVAASPRATGRAEARPRTRAAAAPARSRAPKRAVARRRTVH
jgi:hypothetical protein